MCFEDELAIFILFLTKITEPPHN